MANTKICMDDGFNAELVETAMLDGIFEIPILDPPKNPFIPQKMIPIDKIEYTDGYSELVVPYVKDNAFGDVVRNPMNYVDTLKLFPGITTLDNSLYWDSPLLVQIANVYRNRAIGYFFQQQGLNVIPNVRWGDERSYTTCLFPECFAFAGVPKHSIVSVGSYGACKTREEKYHLRNGMKAMLDILQPETVLIYGAMPDKIFHDMYGRTQFVQYIDWTSSKKKVC